jgi:SAM-dependent methyltransferase
MMSTTLETPALTPTALIELGTAFRSAKVLLGAVELGLFTVLADRPLTEPEIRDRLGLHPRGSRDFLHALVRLGLLESDGERYGNGDAADRHLVRGRPGYVGGFLQRADRVLYPAWGNFIVSLRTGESQIEGRGDDNMFARLYRRPDQITDFLAMMDALTGTVGPELSRRFDWSRYGSVLDVGGGRGNLAAVLVRDHPHLRACVFDLPPVEPVFSAHMADLGTEGRVHFRGGDFFADPLPPADVLILGHVLEDWTPERRRLLVRKAFEAVDPGGALLIYDPMLDGLRSPLPNLLTSLTMLVVTHGGSEYSIDDCRGWLREAGFAEPSVATLETNDTLVVAHKNA